MSHFTHSGTSRVSSRQRSWLAYSSHGQLMVHIQIPATCDGAIPDTSCATRCDPSMMTSAICEGDIASADDLPGWSQVSQHVAMKNDDRWCEKQSKDARFLDFVSGRSRPWHWVCSARLCRRTTEGASRYEIFSSPFLSSRVPRPSRAVKKR